jgi:hypothetical protein
MDDAENPAFRISSMDRDGGMAFASTHAIRNEDLPPVMRVSK